MGNNKSTRTTRAGLTPKGITNEYSITTAQAKSFLQEKFDRVAAMMRKNGQNVRDIDIMMFSEVFSKKFAPFMIGFPPDALNHKKKGSKPSNELSMFNPTENGIGGVKLLKPYFDLLSCYIFPKKDADALKYRTVQNNLGLTYSDVNYMKKHLKPHKYVLNKTNYTICYIDPIRVFSDMLSDPNDASGFVDVYVDGIDKLDDLNCTYDVHAQALDKHKKHRDDGNLANKLAKEIRHSISRSNR